MLFLSVCLLSLLCVEGEEEEPQRSTSSPHKTRTRLTSHAHMLTEINQTITAKNVRAPKATRTHDSGSQAQNGRRHSVSAKKLILALCKAAHAHTCEQGAVRQRGWSLQKSRIKIGLSCGLTLQSGNHPGQRATI